MSQTQGKSPAPLVLPFSSTTLLLLGQGVAIRPIGWARKSTERGATKGWGAGLALCLDWTRASSRKSAFSQEVRINHYSFITDQTTVLFLKFPVDLLPSTLKTMDLELLSQGSCCTSTIKALGSPSIFILSFSFLWCVCLRRRCMCMYVHVCVHKHVEARYDAWCLSSSFEARSLARPTLLIQLI